jgi:membrane fusion protein, multidrug efflux system
MNKKRKIQISLLIIFLIVCIVYAWKHDHAGNQGIPESVIVEAEKARTGEILIEAQAVGTLSADKNVQITPEFSGQIAAIYFHDGGFVKQGTPLIQLDDKVSKSKAESTKAALYFSETNYKRMLLLGKQGAISRQAIESAQADLKQKQADAQENQVTLEKMQLRAPFDGVLGKVQVSPGDHVTAGQSLVALTDILHLRVEYSVSEKYLSQLKQGQEVKIVTSAYPGKVFSGKVAYISPTINTDDRTLSLYAEINNDDRLLTAGLFVNVTQFLGAHNRAILVSAQSLVPTIDGQKIFKIVDGKAISVPVTIGQRNTESVQIDKGIEAGDMVVTAGQEKLKDGMPVIIKAEQKKSLT